MSTPAEEFTADAGSLFELALTAARAAYERREVETMDEQYRYAVQLAPGEPPNLRRAIGVEHVTRLRALGDSTRALARCAEYLAGDGESVWLRLVRAETDLTRGDFSRIDAELAAIRRIADGQPGRPADDALLSRLAGLAAARHGRFSLALRQLRQARDGYAALGDNGAVTVVDQDIRALNASRGGAAPELPAGAPDTSPQARLARSEELRLVGRYEEALNQLTPVFEGPRDPAMRFFFLDAQVRLLRLLHADDEADELMPRLYEAAGESARPEENRLAAQRLDPTCTAGFGALVTGDHGLQHVRRLAGDGQLAEAQRLLLAERGPAEPDDRHAAEWHLAAGELTMAIFDYDRTLVTAAQAVDHFQESVRHAASDSLVAIRITALRLLGRARAKLHDMDQAVEAWAAAHRLEESVAALQPTDRVRIRMLRAAADEFDEQIQVAAHAIELGERRAAAAVVVAMEAARGAAILHRILTGQESLVRRELPRPSDIAGARRWVRRTVRELPRSQIVWMLHATPTHVHHAFVGRRTLRHVSVPCKRDDLIKSIEKLVKCWTGDETGEQTGGQILDKALEPGSPKSAFDLMLDEVAKQLGIVKPAELPENVKPAELPKDVKLVELPGDFARIAVVAGGELSEIPFALLPCPGQQDTLIGRRYALSDLPCLSVRNPLHRRSRRQRGTSGTRMLLVQGPNDPDKPNVELTSARDVPGRRVRKEDQATPVVLHDELVGGRYRQVRIDSHGHYGGDPAQAAIQLDPWGTAGELSPDEFQAMNLGATGTLVLGACETGMFRRLGRDERTGFVRAALLAGSSAVVAARWEALDPVAARVLDRFEKNLRHHPRDVALFLAQREEDSRDPGPDPSAMEIHPARWAPWTLYGDVGYQTRCGPVRRWLSRLRRPLRPTSRGQ